MCFSIPLMFELIPFDCSRMVLLAEVSAKWINFDYLSLYILIFAIIVCHIFPAYLIYIFKCMFVAYSQNVCGIFARMFTGYSLHI